MKNTNESFENSSHLLVYGYIALLFIVTNMRKDLRVYNLIEFYSLQQRL